MKFYKILFLLLLFFLTVTTKAQEDLYFSKYLEGKGYDKALELHNPSNEWVDLFFYQIEVDTDGKGFADGQRVSIFDLKGMIPPHGSYLMVRAISKNEELKFLADTLLRSNVLNFNGNEQIRLREFYEDRNGLRYYKTIDLIGSPGSAYDMKDKNLVRKTYNDDSAPNYGKKFQFNDLWSENKLNDLSDLKDNYNPYDPLRSIDKSKSVGACRGVASVSGSGAASYQIPIDVLPGINGLQPQFSITYNSQAGNGLLGKACVLSGLSSITRIPQTIFHDGESGVVNLDKEDRLALDGNRLFLKSGNEYWSNNTKYSTELANFSNIRLKGTGQSIYFTVETKDGYDLLYGNSSDSKVSNSKGNVTLPRKWLLKKVSDKNGNTVEYFYDINVGYNRIKEVRYNNNSIVFTYSTDRNSVKYILLDDQIHINHILTNVDVKRNNKVLYGYKLKYNKNNSNKTDELISVTKYNGNQEELNPTKIIWEHRDDFSFKPVSVENAKGGQSFSEQRYAAMDYNGDGLDDFIGIYKKPDGYYAWQLYINETKPGGDVRFSSSSFTEMNKEYVKETYLQKNLGTISVDGKGNGEHQVFSPNFRAKDGKTQIYFRNFDRNLDDVDHDMSLLNEEGLMFTVTDFDENGKKELFILHNREAWIYELSSSEDVMVCKRKNGYDVNLPSSSKITNSTLIYGDFNVNGKPDLLVFTDKGICALEQDGDDFYYTVLSNLVILKEAIIKTGDFNGDGETDLIISREDDDLKMKFLYSSPFGFKEKGNQGIYSINDGRTESDNSYDNIIVMDFNEDGKDDFITFDADFDRKKPTFGSSYYRFNKMIIKRYEANDSGFSLVEEKNIGSSNCAKSKYYISGDFNGDGRIDILNYGYKYLTGDDGSIRWQILSSLLNITDSNKSYYSGLNNGLVREITDGLGNRTNFSYRPMTDKNVVRDGSLSDFEKKEWRKKGVCLMREPLYVVSEMKNTDGLGGELHYKYTYDSPMVHRHGRGFLSFLNVETRNLILNVTERKYYKINSKYIINHLWKKQLLINNRIKSASTFNYEIKDLANKCFFSYVANSTQRDHVTGTTTTTENKLYDDFGNLKEQVVTYGNSDLIVSTINNYTTKGAWCPGKIESTSVKKTYKSEAPFTVNSSFTYYDNGNLKSSTSRGIKTEYQNYEYGKPRTVMRSAGGKKRTTRYVYERGLVKTVTNQLNQSESYTYNDFGNPLSKIDIGGKKTSYSYNTWGELQSVTLPNGKISNHSIHWAPANNYNALYYSQTLNEGAPNKKVFYDRKGRQVGTETEGYVDLVYTRTKYNNKGQVVAFIGPHYQGGLARLTSTIYDENGRVVKSIVNNQETSYQYSGLATQVNSSRGKFSNVTNAVGDVISSTDSGGTINYKYHSSGQPREILSNQSKVIITYNQLGLRQSLNDPDAGTTSYTYNGFGDLQSQTDAKGNVSTILYDELGRLKTKTIKSHTISYEYYDSGNGIGQLKNVSFDSDNKTSYTYNKYGSPITITEKIGSKTFTTGYSYNQFNQVSSISYPSNFTVSYEYNSKGFLDLVKRGDNNQEIWKVNSYNALGHPIRYVLGNGKLTDKTYNNDGYLIGINTAYKKIQNLKYKFNSKTGNLEERSNLINNRKEVFSYDKLNRLTASSIGAVNKKYEYLPNGNIAFKTHVGKYEYDAKNKGPHAVSAVDNEDGIIKSAQSIKYNAFNKVSSISQDKYRMTFNYGHDLLRRKTQLFKDGALVMTKYFVANYEEKIIDGNTQQINYIHAGDGLAAIYISSNGKDEMLHVHKDHLGSIQSLTKDLPEGKYKIVKEFSYDPWGMRTFNDKDGFNKEFNYSDLCRGYTGHEHLPEFGLINMNGRLYDPLLGRFLSPDNFVQMPNNTQSYNRFAYCLNNPLIYIDPTGQKSWLGKFTSWVKKGWDEIWDAGNQFARWADQNGLHSGNIGITSSSTGDFAFQGMLNGQPLDWSGETKSINQGVANASFLLSSQRDLIKLKFPFVTVDPLIFNGAWYYDPSDPLRNYSLEQVQFNAWYERSSGRVELTDSPIDYLIGTGIGKAIFKGSSRLVGRVAARRSSSFLRGGKTFVQYKATRGGTQTLARISTSTGTQRISTEFHHLFLTQRMQRAYNLPNWMVNNRLNVWKLNTVQHSLVDSYRYKFLRAGFKPDVGWFGKYNWFTKF
jgi:RHS repeat-associated protein